MAGRKRQHNRIEAVRRFNRFYTRQIGLLQERLLKSPFSLTEARVLYEITHLESTTATELAEKLQLDAGYLSRILRGFQKKGLIERKPSATDGRQSILRMTRSGEKIFGKLDAETSDDVGTMLGQLGATEQDRLLGAMETIEGILMPEAKRARYTIRPPHTGDIGWVIHRHGALYAEEYGWDERFEALVGEIAIAFLTSHDPARERCWIAEMGGENVGSIFLVKKTATIAKLRLLLVEPKARGLGIGKRLVAECLDFAREAGYRKVVLWTNDILHAARHIYIEAGFTLVHEEPHDQFGENLIGQTWEITL